VSLNGELFVSSSDEAVFVLLELVWLELVLAAARLVVTIMVGSLPPSGDTDKLALVVRAKVDDCVIIYPLESVVVYVLTLLDINVTVDPCPDNVVVIHSVIGYTIAKVAPPSSVVVLVTVETDGDRIFTVEVASNPPPVVGGPPIVTVFVS